MSYGMPLVGLVALAVITVGGAWRTSVLPVAVAAAWVPVLGFAAAGFAWWEAYPVLHDRYWEGIAADRPAWYWLWGNLAALAVVLGPMVWAGLAVLLTRVRALVRRTLDAEQRAVVLLAGAMLLVVLAADASRMSKSEVERIWIPFVPWLTLSVALLPARWRSPALLAQVVTALLVQHLLYTTW
jgi:broad specificity phosphatase PhoE